MASEETGRISAIHHHISLWQVKDHNLEDVKGFLEYLKTCDIGCYPVQDTAKWMSLLQEARKLRISVAKLIFMRRKFLVGKEISIEKGKDRSPPENVFVVDEEQRRELEEIGERLKRDDPARRKREL